MEITCVLYGPFQESAGQRSIEYELDDGSTVRELLAVVNDTFPELEISLENDRRTSTQITRNKTHIHHEDGPETVLEDGDVVRIFGPVTGG